MTSVVQFAGGVVVFFGLLTSPKEVGKYCKKFVFVGFPVFLSIKLNSKCCVNHPEIFNLIKELDLFKIFGKSREFTWKFA